MDCLQTGYDFGNDEDGLFTMDPMPGLQILDKDKSTSQTLEDVTQFHSNAPSTNIQAAQIANQDLLINGGNLQPSNDVEEYLYLIENTDDISHLSDNNVGHTSPEVQVPGTTDTSEINSFIVNFTSNLPQQDTNIQSPIPISDYKIDSQSDIAVSNRSSISKKRKLSEQSPIPQPSNKKPKLYEMQPFDDPEKEQRRLNAVTAKNNRLANKEKVNILKDKLDEMAKERDYLKRENDMLKAREEMHVAKAEMHVKRINELEKQNTSLILRI